MSYTFYITPTQYDTALEKGITAHLLNYRVRAGGWNIERAVSTPPRVQGKYKHWLEVAKQNGICGPTFYGRVRKGMEPEQAATMPVMTMAEIIEFVHRKYQKDGALKPGGRGQ